MKWVKASERLPKNSTISKEILFVNEEHSSAVFWDCSFSYSAKAFLEAYLASGEGWELEKWKWLDEEPEQESNIEWRDKQPIFEKDNAEWQRQQPQQRKDNTRELLDDIISWEKDLSEYRSLEGILRERYLITKR